MPNLLTLSPELYYSTPQEQWEYTHTPTGKIDTSRLFQKKAFFRKPGIAHQAHPKKLILADWSMQSWSDQKRSTAKEVFTALIDKGFSLYIEQEGEIVPLSKEALSSLKQTCARVSTVANMSVDLDTLLAEGRLPSDFTKEGSYLLDYHRLQALLREGDVTAPHRLYSSDYSALREKSDKKTLLSILQQKKQAHTKLEEIVHDVFSEEVNTAFFTLKSHFPSTPCRQNYERVELETSLTSLATEDNEQYMLNNATLNFSEIAATKCLYLYIDSNSIPNVPLLLPCTRQLERLHISSQRAYTLPDTLSNLIHLKEMELSGNTPPTELHRLLEATPHLQKLHVSDYRKINDAILGLKPNSLRDLEEVEVCERDISTTGLYALSQAAPYLKKLYIKGCEKLHDIHTLPPHSFPYLEEIDASCNHYFTATGLQALLQATPRLKKLNIGSCQNIHDALCALQPNSLPHLEEMDISSCEGITETSLQALLQAAPHLKTLRMEWCKNLMQPTLALEPNSLSYLEEIYMEGSSIHPENIKTLAHAAPHLKRVHLNAHNILFFPPNTLLDLEEIYFSRTSKITAESVEILVEVLSKSAPHLSHLSFSGCENIQGNMPHLKKNSLPHLKTMDLSSSSITTAGLTALLHTAPFLTKLDISRCEIPPAYLEILQKKRPGLIIVGWPRNEEEKYSAEEEEYISADPVHNLDTHITFKPTPPDAPFQFTGKNKTKNQDMVIERLSQYLLLKNKKIPLIPRLQNGICNALSHYFTDVPISVFEAGIEEIVAWNGQHPIPHTLALYCDTLLKYVEDYQFAAKIPAPYNHYLGEGVARFLEDMQDGSSCVLNNPWHALAVKRISAQEWHIYDPNFPGGCKKNITYDALRGIITKSLGNLVGVESNVPLFMPDAQAGDLDIFLQEGGLFPLVTDRNTQLILQQMEAHPAFSFAALHKGVCLLKKNTGKPAWVHGIEKPHTKALTEKLLAQFRDAHPEGPYAAKKALEKSIEDLSDAEQSAQRTFLASLFPHTPSLLPDQKEEKGSNVWVAYYKEKLKTWETKEAIAKTLDAYTTQCVQKGVEKQLITLSSKADIQGIRFALQEKAREKGRPLFYIHSPEELTCCGITLDAEGYPTGAAHGGELYDFLQMHQQDAPILVINYDTFSAEDIVRLNTVINTEKAIDHFALPKKTQVIGLINTSKSECYQGADFYGRFPKKERCPIATEALQAVLQKLEKENAHAQMQAGSKVVINLFEDPDWKTSLLGTYLPTAYSEEKGQRFCFQEGSLAQIKPGSLIEIQNAPHTEACVFFWKELQQKSKVRCAGRDIDLSGCSFVHTKGYTWDRLQNYFQPLPNSGLSDPSTTVLTPEHLPLLLGGTQLDPHTGGFHTVEGKIALQGKMQEKSLPIYLTRTLTKDQWARLLTACETHQVRLQVQCAEGVTLPQELQPLEEKAEAKEAAPFTTQTPLASTQIITSTDVDTTVAQLKQKAKWDISLDISELDAADLLTRVYSQKDAAGKTRFYEKECVLLAELKAGKNILLTGRCATALADQLAPLLLTRFQTDQPTGRLCIVTEPPATEISAPFQYLPPTYQHVHSVAPEEKLSCLQKTAYKEDIEATKTKLHPFLNEPLAKLQVRYDFLAQFPESTAEKSSHIWNPLHRLPGLLTKPAPFQPENSAQEAAAFHAARKADVDAALAHKPYVLLLGYSGVGKTTSIKSLFNTVPNTLFTFCGEESLAKWRTFPASEDGCHYLFVDEATTSTSEWSRFESLFHNPPGILIEGEYHVLDPKKHKVIFAGNPVSYSTDRKAARLFERHGNTLVWDPLPTAVLYEDVLRPLFTQIPFETETVEKISAYFLEVYRFLVSCSETDVLISPRELEMMALLTIAYCAAPENAKADPLAVAEHYAFTLARNLVPETLKPAFHAQFTPKHVFIPISPEDAVFASTSEITKPGGILRGDSLSPPLNSTGYTARPSNTPRDFLRDNALTETSILKGERYTPLPTPRSADFLITPSRESLAQKIDEWLHLRAWRKAQRKTLTPKQLYGGLGGITIEGIPRIGKSDLILNRLACHGFTKRSDAEIDLPIAEGENVFYMMQNPTRSSLIKAFHQGAVVVIDEANSSPAMEELLNCLLMGKTPENEPPDNPGFMVIYTQNSAKTTAGRRATSTASARRNYTEELPLYPREEMEAILLHKELPLSYTEALITALEENMQQAPQEKRSLLPSFVDVLNTAKETLHMLKQHTASALPSVQHVSPPLPHFFTDYKSGFFTMLSQNKKPIFRLEAQKENTSICVSKGEKNKHERLKDILCDDLGKRYLIHLADQMPFDGSF